LKEFLSHRFVTHESSDFSQTAERFWVIGEYFMDFSIDFESFLNISLGPERITPQP
jgi:hypothetical protein